MEGIYMEPTKKNEITDPLPVDIGNVLLEWEKELRWSWMTSPRPPN